MIHTFPHLQDVRELGTAGGSLAAQDLVALGPDANTPARFVRAIDISSGASLEVTLANGNTRAYTVWAGWELLGLDIVATTANTTCDVIQVGWE